MPSTYFSPRYFPRSYFPVESGTPPTPPPPGPGEYFAPRYFALRYFGQHQPAVTVPPSPGVPGKYFAPRYFNPRYFPWYGPLQIPPSGKGTYWAPKYFTPKYFGQNQASQVVVRPGPGPYWARRYFAPRYFGYFFPLGIGAPSTPPLWTFRAGEFAPWTFRSWYSLGPQGALNQFILAVGPAVFGDTAIPITLRVSLSVSPEVFSETAQDVTLTVGTETRVPFVLSVAPASSVERFADVSLSLTSPVVDRTLLFVTGVFAETFRMVNLLLAGPKPPPPPPNPHPRPFVDDIFDEECWDRGLVFTDWRGKVFTENAPGRRRGLVFSRPTANIVALADALADRAPGPGRELPLPNPWLSAPNCAQYFILGTWDPPLDFYAHTNADDQASPGVVELDYSFRGEVIAEIDIAPPDDPIPYVLREDYDIGQPDCTRQRATLYFYEPGVYFYQVIFDSGDTDVGVIDYGVGNRASGGSGGSGGGGGGTSGGGSTGLCSVEDRRTIATIRLDPPGAELYLYAPATGWPENPGASEWDAIYGTQFATAADSFSDLTDMTDKIIAKATQLQRPIGVILASHGDVNTFILSDGGTRMTDSNVPVAIFMLRCHGYIRELYFASCCTGDMDPDPNVSFMLQELADGLYDPAQAGVSVPGNTGPVTVNGWQGIISVLKPGRKRVARILVNRSAQLVIRRTVL